MKKFYPFVLLLTLSTLLTSCARMTLFTPKDGAPSNRNIDVSKIPNAIPRVVPQSKYGNKPYYCVAGECYHVLKTSKGYVETGIASWYGTKFDQQATSDGEIYDMLKMTAAHKTLPLPTYVRVTNLQNGKQIIVKVNDRGPFERNRIIDLSYVAAKKLNMLGNGTALVKVEAIDPAQAEKVGEKIKTVAPMKHSAIYLQIGAYANYSNAVDMQKRAEKATHYPVEIEKGELQNKPLYRVKVGPIDDVNTADKITQQLETTGFKETTATVKAKK